VKQTFETEAQERARLAKWHPFFAILPREVAPGERRYLEVIERRITWVSSPRPFPFHIRGQNVIEFRAVGAPDREVPDPYKWFRDTPKHKPPAPKSVTWKSDAFIDSFMGLLRGVAMRDINMEPESKITIFHSLAADRWFIVIGNDKNLCRAYDAKQFTDAVIKAADGEISPDDPGVAAIKRYYKDLKNASQP